MTLVAIDGPAGSGKSTVAAALAARLGLARLDTGAMYRAVALAALERGVDPGDADALAALARGLEIEVAETVRVDGRDVSAAIRSPEVNAVVSEVAAHPAVRAELVRRQRAWALARGSGVVEGRDIGTVVLPDATLKVYLDADPAVRAQRRAAGGHLPGEGATSLRERDAKDAGRAASPLRVAPGALVIDSSVLGVDEVVGRILAALAGRGGVPPTPTPAPPRAPRPAPASRGPGAGELAFYRVCRAIAVGASHLYFPGPVLGRRELPRGPFILAPTHRSYVDWLIAARVTRRRLRYLVKEEVWRSRVAGRLLEALGASPVARNSADRQAITHALGVLRDGEPIVVFPEGTRRRGPAVADIQEGAAYLALRAGVPIVPVALGGSERAMPRGSTLPRPTRVRILVGEAIDPAAFLPGAGSGGRVPRVATHALTEHLRQRLQELLDAAEGRAGAEGAAGGGG